MSICLEFVNSSAKSNDTMASLSKEAPSTSSTNRRAIRILSGAGIDEKNLSQQKSHPETAGKTLQSQSISSSHYHEPVREEEDFADDSSQNDSEKLNTAMWEEEEEDENSILSEESIYLTWHTTPAVSPERTVEDLLEEEEENLSRSDSETLSSDPEESQETIKPYPDVQPAGGFPRNFRLGSQILTGSLPLAEFKSLSELLYDENRPRQRQDSMYIGFVNSQPSQPINVDYSTADGTADASVLQAVLSGGDVLTNLNGTLRDISLDVPVDVELCDRIRSKLGDPQASALANIHPNLKADTAIPDEPSISLKLTPLQLELLKPTLKSVHSDVIKATYHTPSPMQRSIKTNLPPPSKSDKEVIESTFHTPSPGAFVKPKATTAPAVRDIFHSIDPELLAKRSTFSGPPASRKRKGSARLERWPVVRKRGSIFLPVQKVL